MALLHRATLVPSKSELVATWLPSRPWAPTGPIRDGRSYRLDDPSGEVGIEGFLLTDDTGVTVHDPLTYRGQPLAGADAHLLGTMEHSVLGTRWVYDGGADPVGVGALARTIATGGTGAEEWVQTPDGLEPRPVQVTLRGTGSGSDVPTPDRTDWQLHDTTTTTTAAGQGFELVLVRRLGTDPGCETALLGTWGDEEGVLAGLRRR